MAREFLKVECEECGNQQDVFSHAATNVECLVCGNVIAEARGGRAEIQGEVVEELAAE